jgi:YfiH family protein
VWLRQVHGAEVVDGAAHRDASPPPEADAAVTTTPGVPLVVQTADCAPLALATDDAVAVVHAGWPGLVAGVVPRAVERLQEVAGGPVRAALGPCVHPCCYEFGRDDLERVVAVLGDAVESTTSDGRLALDIPTAVRVALEQAGVTDFVDVDVCTVTSDDHFSYRRDGTTGRQALVAVLAE